MNKGLFTTLFIVAFIERTFLDLGPNIELVTMAMIVSSAYLSKRKSAILTILILAISDLVIGNSAILLFTWSGFLIPALFASTLIGNKKLINGTLVGFAANLFFFLWTNFGVWLIGGLYPQTTTGLVTCYINALPFLRQQLLSTIIFVPVGIISIEMLLKILVRKKTCPIILSS